MTYALYAKITIRLLVKKAEKHLEALKQFSHILLANQLQMSDEWSRDLLLMSDFYCPSFKITPSKTSEKEKEGKRKVFKSIYEDDCEDVKVDSGDGGLSFFEYQDRITEEIRAISIYGYSNQLSEQILKKYSNKSNSSLNNGQHLETEKDAVGLLDNPNISFKVKSLLKKKCSCYEDRAQTNSPHNVKK